MRGFLTVTALVVATTVPTSGPPLAADSATPRPALPLRPDKAPPEPQKKMRSLSDSGRFALTHGTPEWFVVPNDQDEQNQTYDLTLRHRDGDSFIRAHRGRRNNRGIEGSLIQESNQAKYLIDYEPETVAPKTTRRPPCFAADDARGRPGEPARW